MFACSFYRGCVCASVCGVLDLNCSHRLRSLNSFDSCKVAYEEQAEEVVGVDCTFAGYKGRVRRIVVKEADSIAAGVVSGSRMMASDLRRNCAEAVSWDVMLAQSGRSVWALRKPVEVGIVIDSAVAQDS